MMWQAQTPQGQFYWLSETGNPLVGSALVTYKIREVAESGLQLAWPAPPVQIDITNPGDVRLALEVIYGDSVTFSDNAPEATQYFESADPDLIY